MNLATIKNQSEAKGFVSILGKSTISKESTEYKMIESVVEYIVEQSWGVIHGGYKGGAMEAADTAATRTLNTLGVSAERNIGIAQAQHDDLWERVDGAVFPKAAKDIYDRLRMVLSGDIAVIAPLGGDGTDLELTALYHENVIRESVKKYAPEKEIEPVKPIICLQTNDGTDWKMFLENKLPVLDVSTESLDEYNWLYFANSVKEFVEHFDALVKK